MHVRYGWNELDPHSAGMIRWLIVALCLGIADFYFGHRYPVLSLTCGLVVGTILGQVIPPRFLLRRLVLTLLAEVAIGGVYALYLHFHALSSRV